MKTCEIIIETNHWVDKPPRVSPRKVVNLKIEFGEIELGVLVKKEGGKWCKKEKVWKIPYKNVVKLGLVDRIIWN